MLDREIGTKRNRKKWGKAVSRWSCSSMRVVWYIQFWGTQNFQSRTEFRRPSGMSTTVPMFWGTSKPHEQESPVCTTAGGGAPTCASLPFSQEIDDKDQGYSQWSPPSRDATISHLGWAPKQLPETDTHWGAGPKGLVRFTRPALTVPTHSVMELLYRKPLLCEL